MTVFAALPSARAWGALVAAGFRRYATYRQATLAGAFTNTVFGVVKVSILFAAAAAAGGTVAGYDRAALSTYTWVSQGLIAVVWVFAWFPIALRVRTGDVAIDLGRPVHPVAAWLAEDLGRAGQACLVRFAAPMVVGGLLYGLRLPQDPVTVPLFVLSAALAVVVSFGGRLLVSLVAFWLVDVRGLMGLYVVVSNVLCGLLVPVPFFPDWLRVVAYATPFPSMVQTPVDVSVERVSGLDAVVALAVQAGWALVLLAAAVLVLLPGHPAAGGAGRLRMSGARVYATLLRAGVAGQTAYRTSFAVELLGAGLVVGLDFVEVFAVFTQVPEVQGFSFLEVMLVFALASTAFALGDLLVGQADRVVEHVRSGTFDVVLLRPLSTLGQLATADLQLRKIGRVVVSVVVLGAVLRRLDVDWTPARVALLVLAPLAGAAIFSALFVCAGALSFWLVEGTEVGSALTYGSAYLSQWPIGVLGPVVGRFFTFVVPAAFVGYLPALALLGRPDPTGLPSWLGWGSPVAALVAVAVSALCWRAGVRHYVGAGG